MGKPEAEIEDFLVKSINEIGGDIRKVQWVNHRGAPDRVVFYKGQIVFVECKAPGRQLREHQKREHKKLKAQNVDVLTIDSKAAIGGLVRKLKANAETT